MGTDYDDVTMQDEAMTTDYDEPAIERDPITGDVDLRDSRPEGEESVIDDLLDDGAALFTRWEQIQGRFVDEPRNAVEEADSLVAEVVDQLTRAFGDQREQLERQWKAGSDVSTEELRHALQRYRTFFRRLVAV